MAQPKPEQNLHNERQKPPVSTVLAAFSDTIASDICGICYFPTPAPLSLSQTTVVIRCE